MSRPLNTVAHCTLKAWLAEDRYSRPLSAGQLKTGMGVAVGVAAADGDVDVDAAPPDGVAVRGLVAAMDTEEAEDAAAALEAAAAALDAAGSSVGRPGRPGSMLVVGSTRAVERPPSRLVLGRDSATLGMLTVGRPPSGLEMLRVDNPARGFDRLGIERLGTLISCQCVIWG